MNGSNPLIYGSRFTFLNLKNIPASGHLALAMLRQTLPSDFRNDISVMGAVKAIDSRRGAAFAVFSDFLSVLLFLSPRRPSSI